MTVGRCFLYIKCRCKPAAASRAQAHDPVERKPVLRATFLTWQEEWSEEANVVYFPITLFSRVSSRQV